jgi:transposase
MRSKAYRATDVKNVDWQRVLQGRAGQEALVGLDIGKKRVFAVLRWRSGQFERPWRISNPSEVRLLADRLAYLAQGRQLVVVMEPTGTYGDVFRQAFAQRGLTVHRVSTKMAADYAEIFDGVPSQHDGKDAAVIAELAAQGRSWLWPWQRTSEAEQEMEYLVDWLDAQRRQMVTWLGRVEGLVSRHWPEATRVLGLRSGTLLRVLAEYGGPAALVADPNALPRLLSWGRRFLSTARAQDLLASAADTVGVIQGPWDREKMQRYAAQVLECRQQQRRAVARLQLLARDNAVIQAQAEVVGTATACVLWVHLGNPANYHCGAAYRKAMGLNLAERSSGAYQGKLKISKRGPGTVRRWLYLAALREVRHEPARSWYAHQKQERRQQRRQQNGDGSAKPALVGIMRKLSLVLFQVGARGQKFVQDALFQQPDTTLSKREMARRAKARLTH